MSYGLDKHTHMQTLRNSTVIRNYDVNHLEINQLSRNSSVHNDVINKTIPEDALVALLYHLAVLAESKQKQRMKAENIIVYWNYLDNTNM